MAIPALTLGNLDTNNGSIKTFNEGDEANGRINVELLGYSSTQNLGMYFVIQDPSIVTTNATNSRGLSGTSRMFLQEQDIPHAQEYTFTGDSFTLEPIQQDTAGKETNIYVVDVETGAYNSFKVVNNITKNQRAILSSGGAGAAL